MYIYLQCTKTLISGSLQSQIKGYTSFKGNYVCQSKTLNKANDV